MTVEETHRRRQTQRKKRERERERGKKIITEAEFSGSF